MKGQTMKNYTFAYGKGAVTLPLDERGVIAELHGNDVPAIAGYPRRAGAKPRRAH